MEKLTELPFFMTQILAGLLVFSQISFADTSSMNRIDVQRADKIISDPSLGKKVQASFDNGFEKSGPGEKKALLKAAEEIQKRQRAQKKENSAPVDSNVK